MISNKKTMEKIDGLSEETKDLIKDHFYGARVKRA